MKRMCVSVLLAVCFSGFTAEGTSGGVVLKPLTGEETGLKQIMEKWKTGQLDHQGGKFQDHGWWLWGLRAFDYNNDGSIDLLAVQHGSPNSMILSNQFRKNGSLTFVNANVDMGLSDLGGLAGCFSPLALDIDGDGFIDLAYCDALPNTVWFNREGKKFEPMGFTFGQLAGIGVAQDVDDNGRPYIVTIREHAKYFFDPATKKYRKEAWEIPYLDKPCAAAASFVEEGTAGKMHSYYIDAIDLNGDGIPDVALGRYQSYGDGAAGRYLTADKFGNLTDATEQLALPKAGTPILIDRLDGDNTVFVLAARGKEAGLYVSNASGKFSCRPGALTDYLRANAPYLHKAVKVDLDNSGRSSVVVWVGRFDHFAIFENRGGGEFKQLHRGASWTDAIAVCDINDDGLMDICAGGVGETITIFQNQTPNPGNFCNLFPRMENPNPFAVGARVEIFKSGDLGKSGTLPILVERAHPDGTPIHVGLGKATTFDMLIQYPGKNGKHVELKGVEARHKLTVTPDGQLKEK